MFKSIALTALLSVSLSAWALAPFVAAEAAKEGVEFLSGLQDGMGEFLDILDVTEDLASELGADDATTDELSVSLFSYNRELSQLKEDMRTVGYTEEQVTDFSERLNSSQSSLSQKMRSLKKTIRSMKRLKNTVNRLLNKKGAEVAVQRGLLSTQQQALHLQMQQMQWLAVKDLDEKRSELANRKATEEELNRTTQTLAKKQLAELKQQPVQKPQFQLTALQRWAAMASVLVFCVGCVGVLFGLFRQQGINAIRAGIFGFILSYILPGVVHLYRHWLGV
jgi:hypothetical protein